MERGEFDARMPRFALPEFDAISHTFNGMADGLAESHAENRRLALIAEQSGDAILIQDLEGRISYWNPAAERLFGWPAAQIVGPVGDADRAAGTARLNSTAHSETIRARGVVDHVETQRLARDGRRIEVALTAAPLVDPASNEVIGEICSLRDITEVKRAREAEAELAQNRKLTQVIQSRLEEERHAIARELHDELGQCVTAIKTIGSVIANRTEGDQPGDSPERADHRVRGGAHVRFRPRHHPAAATERARPSGAARDPGGGGRELAPAESGDRMPPRTRRGPRRARRARQHHGLSHRAGVPDQRDEACGGPERRHLRRTAGAGRRGPSRDHGARRRQGPRRAQSARCHALRTDGHARTHRGARRQLLASRARPAKGSPCGCRFRWQAVSTGSPNRP